MREPPPRCSSICARSSLTRAWPPFYARLRRLRTFQPARPCSSCSLSFRRRRRIHLRATPATPPQRPAHNRRRPAPRGGGHGARRRAPSNGTRTLAQAGTFDGLLLGLAQTCALAPGVSRSGAVLSGARARGFSRIDSATLARRTGLPVILGAGALKTARLFQNGGSGGGGRTLALGGIASLFSTLAAIRLLSGEREIPGTADRCCPTRSTAACSRRS